MISIEGIEDAVVGWANLGRSQVVVYSIDRLSNIIYKDLEDDVTPEDVDEIVEYLEGQVSSEAIKQKIPPPIFVRTGDWSDIERDILGG